MNQVMNSSVWLSLMTAFALAVGAICIKAARDLGATTMALCVTYAIPLIMIGAATRTEMQAGPSSKPVWLALLAGVALAASYWTSCRAFSLPTGHVSLITGIIGTYPAITLILALLFTKEARKINLSWTALGITLVVSGVVIIATRGQKSAL